MNLRISSPCPESWDEMDGDDRVRFCGRCNLNVYNLAVMSREEVEALVRRRKGRLCGRLYMRGNRKATLRDCAGGRRLKVVRRAVALGAVLLIGVVSWLLRRVEEPDRSIHPPFVQKVLDWIAPEKTSIWTTSEMLGVIVCPAPPSPPPPPPPPPPIPTDP